MMEFGTQMHQLLEKFANQGRPTDDFRPGARVIWKSRQGTQFGTLTMRWIEQHRWAVQLDQHPAGSVTILHEKQMELI